MFPPIGGHNNRHKGTGQDDMDVVEAELEVELGWYVWFSGAAPLFLARISSSQNSQIGQAA
jgi:hypothetical protein